ncbi:murein biosynthesis integral membrane protein MurJ [Actinotalea sp. Marseille-Q4924]|uniref:murein biosynthesis integral membrane protein MurJ n=1 Tax=Actinotalea sp. Marseille-Q4924 TaxID=2866571 RepID=UPI001CE45596|nr:lipid II flippase MurJ [Actinotalea sp. Marseille-Q4924]
MGPTLSRRALAPRALTGGIAGAAAMIAVVTVVSRVAGFGRTVVQSGEVGATALGDAYNTANLLPNVLFEVAAGGALAGAVVPLLAAPLARSMKGEVDRIASALLGWCLVVLVPLAVLLALLADPLAELLLRDAPRAQVDVAAALLRVFAPQVPLYGVGVVLTGVLQAQRRFLGPALAPLLSSLVVIAVYLAFGRLVPDPTDLGAVPPAGISLLGWGTTAGVAALSLPLLVPVRRTGVRLRPTLRFPPGVARRARSLAAAGLGALLAQQVSVVATIVLANQFGARDAVGGAGTLSVVLYSQAVYVLPYAVLAVPVATAVFPRLAERASQGDTVGYARLVAGTTRVLLVVAVLGATMLVAAAPAVERFFAVYGTGTFTGMAAGLSWTAPGLVGFTLVFHLSRALYALERGRAAVVAAASGWLTVAVTAVVLVPLLTGGTRDQTGTLVGLGAANTVGMVVAGAALAVAVSRAAGGAAMHRVGRTAVVVAAAGALAVTAGRGALGLLGTLDDVGVVGAMGAGVLAGGVAAAVVLVAVGALDRSSLRAVLRRGAAGSTDA